MTTYHCFFEQSGTFKNVFKKLGYTAYDYDILNDFEETDYQIDLYNEINKGYSGGDSLFDKIETGDYVIAFFPCIRFESQILLGFRGESRQMKNWSLMQKLENDLKLHKELSELYELITKLAILSIRKDFKLIIENPYSSQHYLTRYWCIKPTIIDLNRHKNGDYYKKPTQYFFINCEPKNNVFFEPIEMKKIKKVDTQTKVNRSKISSGYAERFIKNYIIDY